MERQIDISNTVLETPRLLLRGWSLEDLADFYEYARVEGVGEMAGWTYHKSLDESENILKGFIEGKRTFAVVYKENNKVIGSVGIEEYPKESETPKEDTFKALACQEIGYVLSKDYWGRGLMPEAVNAVISYCFDTLELDVLLCGYFQQNDQSRRVSEKCGFRYYRDINYETAYGTVENAKLNILYNKKFKIT